MVHQRSMTFFCVEAAPTAEVINTCMVYMHMHRFTMKVSKDISLMHTCKQNT